MVKLPCGPTCDVAHSGGRFAHSRIYIYPSIHITKSINVTTVLKFFYNYFLLTYSNCILYQDHLQFHKFENAAPSTNERAIISPPSPAREDLKTLASKMAWANNSGYQRGILGSRNLPPTQYVVSISITDIQLTNHQLTTSHPLL